ncbi:hypothetical protein ABT224_11415 [Streptomyces sp. NPDC001584]|uniref:hypothetical protein n=1 Tax=Streptomyces sp. NPDC001584 TaxID=3154521 RepID=UPI0033310B8A
MATAPRQIPKVYPAGTGRPTDRTLTDEKVVRTVNVAGTAWEAGKKRAGRDEVSISHAVGLFLEAYAAGLLDLDAITAQLDVLAAGGEPAAVSSAGAWTEEAPSALAAPGWSSTDDVPNAFDILDPEDRP